MTKASLFLTVAVAALAGFAAGQLPELRAPTAEAQQVQRFGHIQAESLTLVGAGRVRGGMHIDGMNRAVLQLRDPSGNYDGIQIMVGDGGYLQILDRNGQPLSLASGPGNLPPLRLQRPGGGGGKGDAPSPDNIRYLHGQINALWGHVAEIQNRLNMR